MVQGSAAIINPSHGLWKHAIPDGLRLRLPLCRCDELVRLLPVTGPVCQL